MGIIPRSKLAKIFIVLGVLSFLWAVFIEVFWIPASRHKICMGGPVNEVNSSYLDVTGDGVPDEVRLNVSGKNWSAPFKWTLTIISGNKVVYERSADDAWLDKFFNDKGYVNGRCNGYFECKEQYYLKDMPSHIFEQWHNKAGANSSWIGVMRAAAKDELVSKFKLTPKDATATVDRMAQRLASNKAQILYVPVSPVKSDSPRMYVPRVGSFVAISSEQ